MFYLGDFLGVEVQQKRHTTSSKPDDEIEKPHNFPLIYSVGRFQT